MTTSRTKFQVGFDRYIAFEWSEYALELATRHDMSRDDRVLELRQYLSKFMHGRVGIYKTANVLTRLWFDPTSGREDLSQQALSLYHETRSSDHVCLHWGISMIAFPLFRDTVAQMGRLLMIQGSFRRQEIHSRLLEKYGNHSTIPRCADRIAQTLLDWQMLKKDKARSYTKGSYQLTNPPIQKWCLEATVMVYPGQRVLLNDVYQLPELFPFSFQTDIRRLVADVEHLHCERDGNNLEYVAVQR